MNDEFTLEKLKIHERLASLETKQDVHNTMVMALLNRHDSTIFGDGNGKRGLDKRVDRIEQRNKLVNAFFGLNIGIVMKLLWDWITKKGG